MPRGKPRPKTIPIQQPEEWRDKFKAASIRVGFHLGLTRPMVEMLSAVADGVFWDRGTFGGLHNPDNFIATDRALEKRRLIERKTPEEFEATKGEPYTYQFNWWKLSPAGVHVVELLKLAGLFIEADAAIEKKARG